MCKGPELVDGCATGQRLPSRIWPNGGKKVVAKHGGKKMVAKQWLQNMVAIVQGSGTGGWLCTWSNIAIENRFPG